MPNGVARVMTAPEIYNLCYFALDYGDMMLWIVSAEYHTKLRY